MYSLIPFYDTILRNDKKLVSLEKNNVKNDENVIRKKIRKMNHKLNEDTLINLFSYKVLILFLRIYFTLLFNIMSQGCHMLVTFSVYERYKY